MLEKYSKNLSIKFNNNNSYLNSKLTQTIKNPSIKKFMPQIKKLKA